MPGEDGKPLRVSLAPGDTVELPERARQRHLRQGRVLAADPDQPDAGQGRRAARACVLALLGLMGSLFIRSRRVWLRVTEGEDGTLVEIAALDRSGGADTDAVLAWSRAAGGTMSPHESARALARSQRGDQSMTDAAWGDAEQPGGRGRRASSTSSRCSRTSSSGPRCGRSTGAQVLVGSGGAEATEPPPAPEVEQHRDRVAMFGRLALLLTGLAVAVHFVALFARGMSADPNRVPWGNMYEFTLAGTFVVAAFYLVMSRRYALDWLGPRGRHLRAGPADGRRASGSTTRSGRCPRRSTATGW